MNEVREHIEILHEDNHLLCVIKPAGMLAQADKSGDEDLLGLCREYIKREYGKPGNVYLGLVHRLDRAVRGPMAFARTSKAAARLSEQFRTNQVRKLYHAAVLGPVEPGAGELRDYLVKDGRKRIARPAAPDQAGAQEARLRYRTLRTIEIARRAFNELYCPLPGDDARGRAPVPDEGAVSGADAGTVAGAVAGAVELPVPGAEERPRRISLLEIELDTGRFHQIRFQLGRLDRPILGDFKYGSRFRLRNREIALEAVRLEFRHPVKNEMLALQAPGRLQRVFEYACLLPGPAGAENSI